MPTITLAGDTMLGRNVAAVLEDDPGVAVCDDAVARVTTASDLFLLNLECCLSSRGRRWAEDPDKPYFFRGPPQATRVLTELGVDVVTLANNHALDFGPLALSDTCAHLDDAGIRWVGAGRDRTEARRPVVLDAAGLRVGIVAATDHPRDFAAAPDRPGTALWDHRRETWALEAVSATAAEVDVVIATVHWGPNMVAAPSRAIRAAARALVAAGADVVAGHSAHVFHGLEWMPRSGRAVPVLYDLGDFVDDYAVHPELRNDLGVLWQVELDGSTPVAVAAVPLVLSTAFTALAGGRDRDWIVDRLARASAAFGTEVVDEGDRSASRPSHGGPTPVRRAAVRGEVRGVPSDGSSPEEDARMAQDPVPLRIGTDRVTTEDVLDVTNPYDGSLVGRVCRGDPAHLDAAVASARAAMADPMATHERAAILDEAARLLADDHDRFARRIAAEAAKPMGTARGEVTRAVDTLRFSAAAARTFAGEVVPMDASSAGEGKIGFTRRVPAGVVAAITPFNFPLNLVLHKLAPSIAAGCAVVLKPASSTPLSAHAIVDLLHAAGLPEGWISVVPCPGRTAMHLVEHDGVAVVSFTGSREVGWRIREAAPRKAVGLELGNTSPLIVAPDADLGDVAGKVRGAGFKHAGQSCISTQRLIVHAAVADDFAERLVDQVASLRVGDPLDDDTDVSQLIDEGERDRVKEWVDEAVAAGARVLAGGEVVDGVLQPTVLADVDQDMRVCREEVFGPVVTLQTWADLDDALAMANDTPYGLQAAIFTADLGTALRAAEVLDFGGVMVNEVPTWRADHMPYGGLRDSGNTREGPLWALRELLTHERLVVLQAPGTS